MVFKAQGGTTKLGQRYSCALPLPHFKRGLAQNEELTATTRKNEG